MRAFLQLTGAERRRAVEAAVLLTAAWLMVRLLPFAWYARLLGQASSATSHVAHASVDGDTAQAVARALLGVGHRLPWESTCLMRALAGRIMLRRRGCHATVFFGAGPQQDAATGFHAWLQAGDVIVSGGPAHGYAVLATFRTVFFIAALAAGAAACADSDAERLNDTIQATYDPETGKLTRITADLNENGTIDTYTYMDGTRILRAEIDADEDGTIEKWEFHGENGNIEKVAISRENNGTPDAWMYPDPDGRIARAELSSEQDASKIDRWEWYDSDVLVRAEEDASGDGIVDKWYTFAPDGAIRTLTVDEDYDGTPDRRLTYGEEGQLLTIESEPDGAGGFRKRIEVGS